VISNERIQTDHDVSIYTIHTIHAANGKITPSTGKPTANVGGKPMSDDQTASDEIVSSGVSGDYSKHAPWRSLEERLDLDERRVESHDVEDELATERARQILRDDIERLYYGELDIDNPPDSIEAFEQRVTLRNLASTAMRFGSESKILLDAGKLSTIDTENIKSILENRDSPVEPARAKKAIDRMATYGQPAEQFLAVVANGDSVRPEIAEYALDALAELQEREEEPDGLVDALRSWWSGGSE
jgi:ribosomal protein L12E/L44/L45/RPP1/RPP2